MLQNLTKPQEGETAAESVQIALAASAPNGNNTLTSPLHRPRRRGRAGHAAALLVRWLAGPAARAAGEWWVARRLACIFDVGLTVPRLELANVYKL